MTSNQQVPLVLNDTLQIPLYQLARSFRGNQKQQEQNSLVVSKAMKDLLQKVLEKEKAGEDVNREKLIQALDKIGNKLTGIREDAKKNSEKMKEGLESIAFRVAMRKAHLAETSSSSSHHHQHELKRPRQQSDFPHMEAPNLLELSVISNHLLRTSRFHTFRTLCKESKCEFLLNDSLPFEHHREIYQALLKDHNAEAALAWCQENRSSLRKKSSNFEFNLRLRQFCEIVKSGNFAEAVKHSRKFLAQNSANEKMRKAMALLAFFKDEHAMKSSPYAHLLESNICWANLAEEFLKERNEIMNLHSLSPLEVLVRVGLSATKTDTCEPNGPGKSMGCPCCESNLGKFALNVPRTMRERSTLVCRITGQVMEDPLVLPNGQAFSRSALENMASARGDGKVLCPITHQEYPLKECKRAFVL